MDKAFGVIRIAAKAGKLVYGEDAVSGAAIGKRLRLIVSAADAGASTQRHAEYSAEKAGVAVVQLPCSKAELGFTLGRAQLAVVAFTDAGFAASFMEKLSAEAPENTEYSDVAAFLREKADSIQKRKNKNGKGSAAIKKNSIKRGESY